MTRIAFADESGTTEKPLYYGIGVVSLDEARLAGFNDTFRQLYEKHGLVGEARWSRISTSYGQINFLLDWAHKILESSTASFDVMIVDTRSYRKWNARGGDRESAFYQTYTVLLQDMARRSGEITEVMIDHRLDAYAKQHEVIRTIGNRMLARLEAGGRLANVRKVSSKEMPGVQVADLLTGAFVAAHRKALVPETRLHRGKVLALERLASILGWQDLCCDTYPHPKFNVWHFPIEFRATPETREVLPARNFSYVSAEELKGWLTLR